MESSPFHRYSLYFLGMSNKLPDARKFVADTFLGGHGFGINIREFQPNPRYGHLCTKITFLVIAIVRHCTNC